MMPEAYATKQHLAWDGLTQFYTERVSQPYSTSAASLYKLAGGKFKRPTGSGVAKGRKAPAMQIGRAQQAARRGYSKQRKDVAAGGPAAKAQADLAAKYRDLGQRRQTLGPKDKPVGVQAAGLAGGRPSVTSPPTAPLFPRPSGTFDASAEKIRAAVQPPQKLYPNRSVRPTSTVPAKPREVPKAPEVPKRTPEELAHQNMVRGNWTVGRQYHRPPSAPGNVEKLVRQQAGKVGDQASRYMTPESRRLLMLAGGGAAAAPIAAHLDSKAQSAGLGTVGDVVSDIGSGLAAIPGPAPVEGADGLYRTDAEKAQPAAAPAAPAAAGGITPPDTPTDAGTPGFMGQAKKFIGDYGAPIAGGGLAIGLIWHMIRKRNEKKKREAEQRRLGLKYAAADPGDELLDKLASACPVVYGFIAGCVDNNASCSDVVDMLYKAAAVSDKFADACVAANEPMALFEKAAQTVAIQEHHEKTADILRGMLKSGIVMPPKPKTPQATPQPATPAPAAAAPAAAAPAAAPAATPAAAPATQPTPRYDPRRQPAANMEEWKEMAMSMSPADAALRRPVEVQQKWDDPNTRYGINGRRPTPVDPNAEHLYGVDPNHTQPSGLPNQRTQEGAAALANKRYNSLAGVIGGLVSPDWRSQQAAESAGEYQDKIKQLAEYQNMTPEQEQAHNDSIPLTSKLLGKGGPPMHPDTAIGMLPPPLVARAGQGVVRAGQGARSLYGQAANVAGRASNAVKAVPGVGKALQVVGSKPVQYGLGAANTAGLVANKPLGVMSGAFWGADQLSTAQANESNHAYINKVLGDEIAGPKLQEMMDRERAILAQQGIVGQEAEDRVAGLLRYDAASLMEDKGEIATKQQRTQRATETWNVLQGLEATDPLTKSLMADVRAAGIASGISKDDEKALDKYVSDRSQDIVATRIRLADEPGGPPIPPAMASTLGDGAVGAQGPDALQEQVPGEVPAEQVPGAAPADDPASLGLDPAKVEQAGPEAAAQTTQATEQIRSAAGNMQPAEVEQLKNELASGDAESPAVQEAVKKISKDSGLDPQSAWDMFNNMDDGAKLMAGLGVALGTISLIASLTSEKGGLMGFLGAVLGFGAAAGTLAHGGVLGEGAQDFTKGIMGMAGIGGPAQATWTPPESPKALTQAEGTPEQMQLAGGDTQPAEQATPAAQAAPAKPSMLTPDRIGEIATQHNLPMGEGDPAVFDEPDQAQLITDFISDGKGIDAIKALAGEMSPQQKQELQQKIDANIGELSYLKRKWYDNNANMQARRQWLGKL